MKAKKKTRASGNGKALMLPPMPTELVALDAVKPHPRNYRAHPEDQLQHIVASIKEHGFYRNVVVARDGTILAGHGVVEAARLMELREIPVVRLKLSADDPIALKLLAGDNEISRLAEIDDRLLTEMLKELKTVDGGLLGTGFDEAMLAALAMVTRPKGEIADANEAAQWVGMPEYDTGGTAQQVIFGFETVKARDAFLAKLGLKPVDASHAWLNGTKLSFRWPPEKKNDLKSLAFVERASR